MTAARGKVVAHIAGYKLVEPVRLFRKACRAEPLHVGLRKILIAALQLLGHGKVFNDRRLAKAVEYAPGKIIEGMGPARAHIKDAVCLVIIKGKQRGVDHLVDIDKIAGLLAVAAVGHMAFKKPDFSNFACPAFG